MKQIEPEFEHLHPQTMHTAQDVFNRTGHAGRSRTEVIADCIARAKAHSRKHHGIEE